MTELESEFANLPGGNPKQSRFLRSQQDLKAKMEAAADDEDGGDADGRAAAKVVFAVHVHVHAVVNADDEDEEEDTAVVMDAYEMADPVNILAKLPSDFYDKLVRVIVYIEDPSLSVVT